MRLWDARTGAEITTYGGHTAPVNTVSFRHDGRRLVSASDDHTVKLWDAENTRPGTRTIPVQANQVALDDAMSRLAYGNNGKTTIVDIATGAEIRTIPGDDTVLAMSGDGRRVATMNPFDFQKTGVVNVWDTTTGKLVRTLGEPAPGRPVAAAAFSPDGRRLVASGMAMGKARLWDVETGRPIATLDDTWTPARFSPDGRVVATSPTNVGLPPRREALGRG